jgi:LysR family positive regulator for ilvC
MEINKLKYFIQLAETCHFNRAAELCHVSPPTLSRNIQQLEEELNVRLFERNNRSVELTQQGLLFLPQARSLIQQWETVRESLLIEKTELSGSMSLYCSVTASYSFLYEILAEFRQQHPGIEIKLHTGDPALAIQRVLSGEEDIAIAAKPDKLPADIVFKSFSSSPLIFISSIEDGKFEVSIGNKKQLFESIPMIIPERGLARDRINTWFRKHNISPNLYAQVSGNEAIVSMVSLGFGIGLVPKIVVDNSPLVSNVKLYVIQPELLPYDVGVCVLQKRLKSPIIEAFWQQFQHQD